MIPLFAIAAARDGDMMLITLGAKDYNEAYEKGILAAREHHGLDDPDWDIAIDDIEMHLDGFAVMQL